MKRGGRRRTTKVFCLKYTFTVGERVCFEIFKPRVPKMISGKIHDE